MMPMFEIAHQMVVSASQLARGVAPTTILTNLSTHVSRWEQEHPVLRDSFHPIRNPGSPLTSENLAAILQNTNVHLSQIASGGPERELLRQAHELLEMIVGHRGSRISGVFSVTMAKPVEQKKPTVVLIVDDEPSLMRAQRRQLERAGFRVLTAENGSEAAEKYQAWYQNPENPPIGIVLLDVNIHGSRSEDILQHLRSLDPNVACLFQSGDVDLPNHLRRFDRASFITKPASLDEITESFESLLKGKKTP